MLFTSELGTFLPFTDNRLLSTTAFCDILLSPAFIQSQPHQFFGLFEGALFLVPTKLLFVHFVRNHIFKKEAEGYALLPLRVYLPLRLGFNCFPRFPWFLS